MDPIEEELESTLGELRDVYLTAGAAVPRPLRALLDTGFRRDPSTAGALVSTAPGTLRARRFGPRLGDRIDPAAVAELELNYAVLLDEATELATRLGLPSADPSLPLGLNGATYAYTPEDGAVSGVPGGFSEARDRSVGMWGYLSALAWILPIPFSNLWGPLIVHLNTRRRSGEVALANTANSVSWQLSYLLYCVASVAVTLVLALVIGQKVNGFFPIGTPLIVIPVLGVLNLIFTIIGAVRAHRGVVYRVPLALPLLRG
ncbi:DUF4870 domain-containing protein [Compostimonas suwonensis]|uniref:Putative Tic20 family protein n=1 Tax=Compostimonas suwonensis TaxID=1048394 RepID=A0A2M9BU34_9MICO|nr:DUF4870 domain-containing protein [Compostimonas suwonensis]PJJ61453.1 putative Tic20 family protein [Compostimonas suwonensis]